MPEEPALSPADGEIVSVLRTVDPEVKVRLAMEFPTYSVKRPETLKQAREREGLSREWLWCISGGSMSATRTSHWDLRPPNMHQSPANESLAARELPECRGEFLHRCGPGP